MKRISRFSLVVVAVTMLLLGSCNPQKARISGTIQGLKDSTIVEFKVLSGNVEKVIDTIKMANKGKFSYILDMKYRQAGFYSIYADGNRVARMVVIPGDAIIVNTDLTGKSVSYKGSEETILFNEVCNKMDSVQNAFDALCEEYVGEMSKGEDAIKPINRKIAKLYSEQKLFSMTFINAHPYSLSNIPLLYQTLSNTLPIFNEVSDNAFFRAVHDSLYKVYPKSGFLITLKEEIDKRDRMDEIQTAISNRKNINFPDIELYNVTGQKVALSSLLGKPIVLSFWYSKDVDMAMDNNELLAIYNKYHSTKGLEIYQVSFDPDKPSWAHTVLQQKMPWISVNESAGNYSHTWNTYNITYLPTFYYIDKEGNLVKKFIKIDELAAYLSKVKW